MDKKQRLRIAEETLEILREGFYTNASDRTVNVRIGKKAAVNGTCYYGPGPVDRETQIEVTDQTTLEAAQELAASYGDVGILNFASAKNPGGGFLRGTQAQEETLARSSALYASLSSDAAAPYYVEHKEEKNLLYSDRMIFTPEVPVFRDDEGDLLYRPYCAHILTAAAPNRRALEQQGKDDNATVEAIEEAFQHRVRKIFHIFEEHDCRVLVLGAWGCGVFGNNPNTVAQAFVDALEPGSQYKRPGAFAGRFNRVRFAIPGADGQNHQVFRKRFHLDPGKESVTWSRVL
jgi:uncharacterized protein (TIGR02452 family)